MSETDYSKTYTQSEVDKLIAKARDDEQYQTLRLLKKLKVIDEDAMTKMALSGEWDAANNMRLARDQVIREDGEK